MSQIPKEFIVERQGRTFVLYAGLLNLAHQQGLRRITTEILQYPTSENGYTTIVRAEVETERGVFTGIGDANPENTGKMIAPHYIRMSETRAKARALRDAVNVGMTALEELGDGDVEPAAGPEADVQGLIDLIQAASTRADLKKVADLIKGQHLPEDALGAVRRAFEFKKRELING